MAAVQDITKQIKNLPPELREKILRQIIEEKISEKRKMGFEKVHKSIKNVPYCDKKGRKTRVIICLDRLGESGYCSLCFMEDSLHFIGDDYLKEAFKEDMAYQSCFFDDIVNIVMRQLLRSNSDD